MVDVVLQKFGYEDLPAVESWFDDVETQRWLGGPGWPRQMLDLVDRPLGQFRGAVETGRYRWLAREAGRAVGYIDCGTYDRWTTWDGEGGDGGIVVDSMEGPAAAITYVVDPTVRHRGYATAIIRALLALPELSHVRTFGAGVEPDNVASVRCLLSCGFRLVHRKPDWEGVVYYLLSRELSPDKAETV